MEQDATRCSHREILSINVDTLVCKLVLAERPERKNTTGAREVLILEVHLMKTDLHKLTSVYALPEAVDTCTTVTQATK